MKVLNEKVKAKGETVSFKLTQISQMPRIAGSSTEDYVDCDDSFAT